MPLFTAAVQHEATTHERPTNRSMEEAPMSKGLAIALAVIALIVLVNFINYYGQPEVPTGPGYENISVDL